MSDVIESILLEHGCEVVLLDRPDSVRSKNLRNVGNKTVRIFEIVEHGDACDDLCFPLAEFLSESLRVEEIVENPVASLLCICDKVLCGFEPRQKESSFWIATQ